MSDEYAKTLAEIERWIEILRSDALDSADNLVGEWGEVVRRDMEFTESGGSPMDALAPVRQWNARKELEDLRQQYEAGRETALLEAVGLCGVHKLLIPEWASAEFTRRLSSAKHFEVQTLDGAFGKFLPDGTQYRAAQKRERKMLLVYRDAAKLKRRGIGTGEALFAELGRRHQISAGTARDYFYLSRVVHPSFCAVIDKIDELLAASKKPPQ